MSIERRQHERATVDWRARAGRKGLGVSPARVTDASIAGLYLETKLHAAIGDHLLIEIEIDAGSAPVLVEGKIMRSLTAPANHFGYGIQFVRIDDASLQRLLAVLATKYAAHQP